MSQSILPSARINDTPRALSHRITLCENCQRIVCYQKALPPPPSDTESKLDRAEMVFYSILRQLSVLVTDISELRRGKVHLYLALCASLSPSRRDQNRCHKAIVRSLRGELGWLWKFTQREMMLITDGHVERCLRQQEALDMGAAIEQQIERAFKLTKEGLRSPALAQVDRARLPFWGDGDSCAGEMVWVTDCVTRRLWALRGHWRSDVLDDPHGYIIRDILEPFRTVLEQIEEHHLRHNCPRRPDVEQRMQHILTLLNTWAT